MRPERSQWKFQWEHRVRGAKDGCLSSIYRRPISIAHIKPEEMGGKEGTQSEIWPNKFDLHLPDFCPGNPMFTLVLPPHSRPPHCGPPVLRVFHGLSPHVLLSTCTFIINNRVCWGAFSHSMTFTGLLVHSDVDVWCMTYDLYLQLSNLDLIVPHSKGFWKC